MKAVILAGGFGSRISEESTLIPKPLIEIGNKPIIWHIMKLYSYYGINEFIICCGYKGNLIKDYFINYSFLNSNIEINLKNNSIKLLNNTKEDWKITLVDTGISTMTGGRLKRIQEYVRNEKFFCLTYGDGLSDVNIKKLIEYHTKRKKFATITAVSSPSRFGDLEINSNKIVKKFLEKKNSKKAKDRINGGFLVLDPKIIKFIKNDQTVFERDTLSILAKKKQLSAYIHDGFWQCMDTQREKMILEKMWKTKPLWKKW